MKTFLLLLILILSAPAFLGGCSYTLRSSGGTKVTTEQVQTIRLGKTTEVDLLRLLGPPTRKEQKPDGTARLLYDYSAIRSPALPWGITLYGLFDREESETFEVILREGVVQSYRFLKN